MTQQLNLSVEGVQIEGKVLLKAVMLPPISRTFQNESKNFLRVSIKFMLAKVFWHHWRIYCPSLACFPAGRSLMQRYQMLRLNISKLLLLGQFLGSLEEHRLSNPPSQSICSFSTEFQQQRTILSRCYRMGKQEAIVYMLYLLLYSCQAYCVIMDSITAQLLETTPFSKVSSLQLSYSMACMALLNSLKAFLMRTTCTRSLILKIFFYILGIIYCRSWSFASLMIYNCLQFDRRVTCWLRRVAQSQRIDWYNSGILLAQLRLFIIGFKLIFMCCILLRTIAYQNIPFSAFSLKNKEWYLLRDSSTIVGVIRSVSRTFKAYWNMLLSYERISFSNGNSSVKSYSCSEESTIQFNLLNLLRQSSSFKRAYFLFYFKLEESPLISRSFRMSSILIKSHNILKTTSLYLSSYLCLRYFTNCSATLRQWS